MKKRGETTKDEKALDILKRVAKRIEEATIDIHEIKGDLKFVNLRLHTVESNTKIVKVDIEKVREDMDDLISMSQEILSKMVTQEELQSLSQRLSSLERQ